MSTMVQARRAIRRGLTRVQGVTTLNGQDSTIRGTEWE